ncbi:MAG: VCBS repeat-containing protein [Betaproteobacteria bacterium]
MGLDPFNDLSSTLLEREANCSLTQYSSAAGATLNQIALPGFDAYAHRIARLTTTAGVFPNGCADRRLGTVSSPVAYLGRGSNGDQFAVRVNASKQIALLRLNASGATVSTTLLGGSNTESTVAAADLNGDGIADIVTPYITANGQSGIGVFLSRADGSYAPVTVYSGYPNIAAAGLSLFAFHVSIEDVNGDGKPDIVAIGGQQNQSQTLLTLLGAGDGSFRPGSSATKAIDSGLFVVADFTGDGKPDLLTASGFLLPGQGDGGFGAPVKAVDLLSLNYPAVNLAVGDFNGDGKLDVAFMSLFKHPFISIALGNGNGAFTLKETYASILGGDYLSVTDIDGDGNADIVVGLAGAGVYGQNPGSGTVMQFLLGRGDGTFAGAPAIPGVGLGLGTGKPVFALADFNGDGYPDLAVPPAGTDNHAIVVQPGSASGQFGKPGAPVALSFRAQMVAAGDVNGDGRLDLVLAGSGRLAVLTGLGSGSFGAERAYALPAVAGELSNLAVGDVNGDGRADVVVTMERQSAATGGAFLYIANADGSLKPPVQFDTATNLQALAVADLTGDGRADIAVGGLNPVFYSSGNVLRGVRVYRGNADGSVTLTATLSQPGAVTYAALAIADMNKDGKPDLVYATQDASLEDTVFIAPGQGDGSFGTATSLVLPDGGPLIYSLAVADFTFDGNLDVMVAADTYAAVLPGKGDGTLHGVIALAIAGGDTYVAAADLNQDTVPDAVMVVANLGIVPLLRVESVLNISVVTEFYNTPLDNYFITANPAEASAIDAGSAGPGWARTGEGFNFNSGGNTSVCRFYGSISPGPNSHFYTVSAAECDGLKALQAATPATQPRWNFESLDFTSTPPINGACPVGTVPVYRAYNNGFNRQVDSNHRITTSQAGIAAVVARGWVSEGIVMCASG